MKKICKKKTRLWTKVVLLIVAFLLFLLAVLASLFIYSATIDLKNKMRLKKNHPVFYAISQNDPELLHQLIRDGHDVNAKLNETSTMKASLRWTRPVWPKVFDRNYSLKDIKEWDNRASALIKVLIDNGADVNSSDFPSLAFSAQWHLENTVKILLKADANPNLETKDYGLPLHEVFVYYWDDWQNETIIKLLVNHGADVNCQDKSGDTPLHLAVTHDADVSIVKFLLEAAADPSLKNKEGQTALDIEKSYPNSNQELIDLLEFYTKKEADMSD